MGLGGGGLWAGDLIHLWGGGEAGYRKPDGKDLRGGEVIHAQLAGGLLSGVCSFWDRSCRYRTLQANW